MKYSFNIFIIIIFQYIYGQAIITGEKLSYKAGFRLITAGESTLELKTDTLNSDIVYHIKSIVKSNSFLDIFYKLRDEIDIWIDQNDFSLLKMKKNTRQGKYRDKKDFKINYSNQYIENNNQIYFSKKVFDPISAIYFLRNQVLTIQNQFILPMFNGRKLREISLVVMNNEVIKVPAGEFDCILVAPSSLDGSKLLKNNGAMKIWFSNDSLKIPVRIEQETNIGTMLLELKSILRPGANLPLTK